ncbi:MAG: toll/interleukin-1 receptor domain-containing protein, partial [Clostridiaceae bacterium]|nr:toll/interleukin-1 receptor domain-containing protein [Clostridiaceae bacterium]
MKYAAFISYRHGGIDEAVGTQIQREIERYRIPVKIARRTGKKKLGKVFRDADDLRAASNLSEMIQDGLDESEYLIAVCTKRYQESAWCMEEIEYFQQTRGRENIIVVLVEGEPEESFPKLLTEVERDGETVHIEPLAVDVRAASERDILKQVRKEKLRFISQMLNMDYDDLRQRQKERLKKQIVAASLTGLTGLGIFIGTILYKNFQLDKTMQQVLKGQSYYLSEYAVEAYENGDRTTAALLALEALPSDLSAPDRPYVPSAMNALTSALGIYDYSNGYQADKVFEFEEEAYDTKAEISRNEEVLLVEKLQSAAGNMLKGSVYLYSMESKELLAEYALADIPKTGIHSMSRCARLMQDSETLVYLAADGVRAVNIFTGKEIFTGAGGFQMVLSEKEDIIAVYNSEEGMIYYYNADGQKLADTEVGTDKQYNLYCISPDSSIAVLSQDAKDETGILLTDTHSGGALFVDKSESCSKISFIDDHSLCFVRQDTQMGRNHIVVYDLNENTDDYLADTDKSIDNVAVSGYGSCFFYSGETVYEISRKTGKVRWENTFSTNVISIAASGNYLAVTLEDGQSYFYQSKQKELINTVSGNGEAFYLLSLGEDYACMGDYWGENIRVYGKKEITSADVAASEFTSVGVPENWYTASSDGDTFLLDLKNGMSDNVLTFSAETLEELS